MSVCGDGAVCVCGDVCMCVVLVILLYTVYLCTVCNQYGTYVKGVGKKATFRQKLPFLRYLV